MWYIFRHGETFRNVKKDMIQGHSKNIFLTLNGALQAHINGKKLKKQDEDFSNYRIVCSPLERTINTCQIIMDEIGRGDNPEYEELIMERSQGIFNGMLKRDIKEKYDVEYTESRDNLWNYKADGYENYRIIFLKVTEFIEKYKNDKNLIVVAHEGVNNSLMYLLKKKNEVGDLKKWIDNLSDEEGNNIAKEVKSNVFDQNYFFSWDGEKFEKI